MGFISGRQTVVSVAVNELSGGTTYGNDPVEDWNSMRVKSGGFTCTVTNKKTEVDEMNVNLRDVVTGGVSYGWTLNTIGSYNNRYNLLRLALGGGITGAVHDSCWTNTYALSDMPLFGTIRVYYGDQANVSGSRIKETLSNVAVTSWSSSINAEGVMEWSFGGVATGRAVATDNTTVPSVSETEIIKWQDFCGANGLLSVGGEADFNIKSLGWDVSQSFEESFDMVSANHASVTSLIRSGRRSITWKCEIVEKRTEPEATIGDTTSVFESNQFTAHNEQSGVDERSLDVTFGDSYLNDTNYTRGSWNRSSRSCSFKPVHSGTTAIFALVLTNDNEDNVE